jgi:hypothetical protein
VKKGLQAIKDATGQSAHKTVLSDVRAAKEKEEREEDLRLEEVARAESLVRATREVATAVKGVCAALTKIASRLETIEEVYTHVVSSHLRRNGVAANKDRTRRSSMPTWAPRKMMMRKVVMRMLPRNEVAMRSRRYFLGGNYDTHGRIDSALK